MRCSCLAPAAAVCRYTVEDRHSNRVLFQRITTPYPVESIKSLPTRSRSSLPCVSWRTAPQQLGSSLTVRASRLARLACPSSGVATRLGTQLADCSQHDTPPFNVMIEGPEVKQCSKCIQRGWQQKDECSVGAHMATAVPRCHRK